jgi:hypothetical protein
VATATAYVEDCVTTRKQKNVPFPFALRLPLLRLDFGGVGVGFLGAACKVFGKREIKYE